MKKQIATISFYIIILGTISGQNSFNYTVDLQPVNIVGLPGLHSYAFAEYDGKWLIIGGRKDGIHARQPFNSFPLAENNTDIYVIDPVTQEFWSSSVNELPTGLKEQLQSTNMNFYQDNDTLYIIGGYAFSSNANDHITFPNLTSINVPSLINAVINGGSINAYFKQISDPSFAVTGGRLGKIDDNFILVGGHQFDGRYNPMNHPTYNQTYTNQIRKFHIINTGSQLSFTNYSAITDPIHLRRRDYNLLPQVFPDGQTGYTISSGVFQLGADLPYLYPVDITEDGYTPVTTFNQYLSNYHSAFACMYDSIANEMHSLFFGGMSQYYYQNGALIQNDLVPFVKTISLLTRSSDGNLQEYQLPVEMPALKGASAEFIANHQIPQFNKDILHMNKFTTDTVLIGYIYGGILSPSLNPFSFNQTNSTSATNSVYSVRLIKNQVSGVNVLNGENPYDIQISPNPADEVFLVSFELRSPVKINYYVTNSFGQLLLEGDIQHPLTGENKEIIRLENIPGSQTFLVTFVFEDKYYVTKKVMTK
jgi:hypothetical protein